MGLYYFLLAVTLLHFALYYVDRHFKGSSSLKNRNLFQRRNIDINLLQLKWSTSFWNRGFTRFGQWKAGFWSIWFKLGMWITILLIVPSVYLLLQTLFTSLRTVFEGQPMPEVMLQPVLPGVNLPSSEIIYYILTLLICSVIHEAGHALAATRENVPLLGFGFFLFFILPAAFVDLPTREVVSLSPWQQLRIYCGGVWHNVALASVGYLLLVNLPILAVPFYTTGGGVYVLTVHDRAIGLEVGDHITQIDNCIVKDTPSWRECLSQVLQEPPKGFCVQTEMLTLAESSVQAAACCPEDLRESHLCFRTFLQFEKSNSYCLRARNVVEKSSSRCLANLCDSNEVCTYPIDDDVRFVNSTKLIQVKRIVFKDALFFGHPADLYSSVIVTSFVPKYLISPIVIGFVESLLKYVVSFSAGLAILNVVPSYALDGQHIVKALCHAVLPPSMSIPSKDKIVKYVVWFGSCLLLLNIILGIFVIFKQ